MRRGRLKVGKGRMRRPKRSVRWKRRTWRKQQMRGKLVVEKKGRKRGMEKADKEWGIKKERSVC